MSTEMKKCETPGCDRLVNLQFNYCSMGCGYEDAKDKEIQSLRAQITTLTKSLEVAKGELDLYKKAFRTIAAQVKLRSDLPFSQVWTRQMKTIFNGNGEIIAALESKPLPDAKKEEEPAAFIGAGGCFDWSKTESFPGEEPSPDAGGACTCMQCEDCRARTEADLTTPSVDGQEGK